MLRSTVCLLFLSMMLSCREKRTNHLSGASSPYLRAQSTDPVDWYEWGDAALAKAKKENKPLLVSVGYSACHWCHVMESETFTDTAAARLMNENFVCIKVDREERPDIDKVFSEACRLLTGNAGWPLNALALPDGKPFFAGTYYSRRSWIDLLNQVILAWRSQRSKIDLQAQTLASGIAANELSLPANDPAGHADKDPWRRQFEHLYGQIDPVNGGLRGSPKFPMPSTLEFCLQYYFVSHDARALAAASNTLTRMALGGIYDQLGGGFMRYSTDSLWQIPHFEKMLSDNAQLLSVYAHAWQLTHDEMYKDIIDRTISFTGHDLAGPDGGYYSSLDADTHAGEGAYYTWTARECKTLLGHDYDLFAGYYHISDDGNWQGGRNVLFASQTPAAFARIQHIDPGIASSFLAADRAVLRSAREKRGRPSADTKVLTSWNALMLTGYLDAFTALGDPAYLQKAVNLASFLENKMLQKDGALLHVFQNGKAQVDGFLDDYAFFAEACLRLYAVSFSMHWLVLAKQLTDRAVGDFSDPHSGMFFFTGRRSDRSVIRTVGTTDIGLPSGNAVMASVLFKLGRYFDRQDYTARAARMLSGMAVPLSRNGAVYYADWVTLAGLSAYDVNEVAVAGRDAVQKGLELQKSYLPLSLFLGSSGEASLPLLEGKLQDGQTLIYICTNKVCKRPLSAPADALALLQHKKGE